MVHRRRRGGAPSASPATSWATLITALLVLACVLWARQNLGSGPSGFFEALVGEPAQHIRPRPREGILDRAARGDRQALLALERGGVPVGEMGRVAELAPDCPDPQARLTLATLALRLRGMKADRASLDKVMGTAEGHPAQGILDLGLLALAGIHSPPSLALLRRLAEASPQGTRERAYKVLHIIGEDGQQGQGRQDGGSSGDHGAQPRG